MRTTLRFPDDLGDGVKERARRNRRSLNAEIMAIVEAALGERETTTSSAELTGSRSPSTALALAADRWQDVYAYWRQARGKSDPRYERPLPERVKLIRTRLRRFTVDELKRAIDGVAADPWEERPLHDDLKVIFRSDAQVEKFLDLAERGAPAGRYVSAEDVLAQAYKLREEER